MYSEMLEQLAIQENSDEDECPRLLRPMNEDEDTDKQLGLRERRTRDNEEEQFFTVSEGGGYEYDEMGFPRWVGRRKRKYPTWIENNNRYFTNSGDSPVIYSEAEVADQKMSAGGWNLIEPEWVPTFYSASKPGKAQLRNLHIIIGFIHGNLDNKVKLERGRKRFWARYFELKAKKSNYQWLFPKYVALVKQEFDKALKG